MIEGGKVKKRVIKKTKAVLTVFVFLLFALLFADPLSAQEAPPDQSRSQTIGEFFEDRLESESSEKSESTPNLVEAIPTPSAVAPGDQKLHLPDRQPRGENWATEGQVGTSTFVDRLIRMAWSLALVSLLIWGAGKIAARVGWQPVGSKIDSKSMIEVIEKKRLSPGRTIMVIRIGPKILAVAVSEKGYETLTEFTLEEFRKFHDDVPEQEEEAVEPEGAVTTPSDIARHYLSIVPGTGVKK